MDTGAMERARIRPRRGYGAAGFALTAAVACGKVEDGLGRTASDQPVDSGAAADSGAVPDASAGFCHNDVRLLPIRDREPCAWEIPDFPGVAFDPTLMNVIYEDTVGPRFLLSLGVVSSSADCGTLLAWYYDDPATPTSIVGCPKTCALAATSSDAAFPGFTAVEGCHLVPDPLE